MREVSAPHAGVGERAYNPRVTGDPPLPALPTVSMLGVGSMLGAILTAVTRDDAPLSSPIRATTASAASAERIGADPRVRATALETRADANRAAVRGAGIVVLGVKPGMIAGLLDEIRDDLEPGAVVVSVAAGVPTAAIERRLPAGTRVVRAMPNTPSAVGLGVTGIAAGSAADDEAMRLVRDLFARAGDVVQVDEGELAAVTGVSGSGPAYVYLFAEALIDAATRLGLDADRARTLAVGTLRGAAEMLAQHAELEPAELRRRVTSPNGTTERAIDVFTREGFGALVERAVRASAERADELAAAND